MELQDLQAPFPPNEIEWRAGATNNDKTSALALAYLTSRAVMDRLDNVCGPDGWHDEYKTGPAGGVTCGISINTANGWITKWDGADNTQVEGTKGGLSDSFKRAGVKWGIGRYLYKLPAQWVRAKKRGNSAVLDETPHLPPWALPEGFKPENKKPAPASQSASNGQTTPQKAPQKKIEQGGPLQWIIDDGIAKDVPGAAGVSNLLELPKMGSRDEQRKLGLLYRGWRNAGAEVEVAKTHALEGTPAPDA